MLKGKKIENKVSIKNSSKGKLPSLPFQLLKNEVLGKEYELSIVFATAKVSQKLNKRFRGKNKPTNILSFTLSPKSGELFIHLPTVKRDSVKFEMNFKNFLGFLLIHGMLHLKGMQHSSKMESKEESISVRFAFK